MGETSTLPQISPGFTFYVVWGAYAGWHIRRDGATIRFLLGRFGICFARFDVEAVFGQIIAAYPLRSPSPDTRDND